MPRRQPTMSWQDVRMLLEKFEYKDPRTGVTVTGFNVPEAAKKTARRKSVWIRYLTLDGHLEEGRVESLKVFVDARRSQTGRGAHQRMIRFVDSGQIRRICDILILEIDGIRIISQ